MLMRREEGKLRGFGRYVSGPVAVRGSPAWALGSSQCVAYGRLDKRLTALIPRGRVVLSREG